MQQFPIYRTGIGQDSHRFLPEDATKPCIIGGIEFQNVPGLKANSDGDVILHAICNAISSLTGEIILGKVADDLCLKGGITDSSVYLKEALKTLGKQQIVHLAITMEGSRPHFLKRIPEMRQNIASILGVDFNQVGITATTGEGLTDFGCGDGLQCFCILTTVQVSS
jgi:2-C-methyl-D-erythritol 2,4-cyclodiphosphate synthase